MARFLAKRCRRWKKAKDSCSCWFHCSRRQEPPMKTIFQPLLLHALLALCWFSEAHAQLEVRLSIKVILEANGMRPAGGTLSTDTGIRSAVDDANRVLASFGRGYQFRITEILDLSGHTELLDLA